MWHVIVFLHQGLKQTMACMDKEHPRTNASINSRSGMREVLRIEGLCEINKAQESPLKSMLEIMVRYHIDGHNVTSKNLNSDIIHKSSSVTETINTRREDKAGNVCRKKVMSRSLTEVGFPSQGVLSPATDRCSILSERSWSHSFSLKSEHDQQPMSSSENDSTIKREPFSNKAFPATEITQNSISHIRQGMIAGPKASLTEKSNKFHQTRKFKAASSHLGSDEDSKNTPTGPSRESPLSWNRQAVEGYDEDGYEFEKGEENIQRALKIKSMMNHMVDNQQMMEMNLDDIDDDEELEELSRVTFLSRLPQHSHDSYPLDQDTAIGLKEVMLGSSTRCFNMEWKSQNFTFSDSSDVRYGIIQKKGGPCGVLASMQGCVLKKLLFEGTNSDTSLQRLRPSNTLRTKCLALAAAEVLWRAGEGKKATIAITSERNNFIPIGQYRSDGVLEKITCITVYSMKDLQLLLDQHIHEFESGTFGCILLTISVILSRSVERVREDMDVPTTTLVGAHGYCTQELVNLFLSGRAVSNVFDNDMELDSGNGNLTLLRGMKGHCDVGLLSLFEHYNICEVGSNLKTPRFPIWLVCSESHFSVLFGLERELLTSQRKVGEFDLYYYDSLANQQVEIRLTVSIGSTPPPLGLQDADTDLIPPLEHCIRTRWRDAVVNWNNTEPIL